MTTAGMPDPRLYVRLAATLRSQIDDGVFGRGSRVPTISELCEKYELSRQTAGKALRLLEGEGVIHRVPGLGYHVS